MNIALVSLRDIDVIPLADEIHPSIILTSKETKKDRRLADIGLQLDEYIHFNNGKIDLVCVINEPNITRSNLLNFDLTDYVDRVYYTTGHLQSSSFFCSPHIFSLISNLYKINFIDYKFKNLEEDTVELLAEKIFFIINRLGIEIKIE